MFGLTAYLHKEVNEFDIQPCSIRYSQIEDHIKDVNNLQNAVQKHKCSSYCIMDMPAQKEKYKKSNNEKNENNNKEKKKQKQRECRMGFGKEQTYGKYDTPGKEIHTEPQINMDKRGFKTLEMPRNHTKVVQSSINLLQSWRANCDIQIILYESDPNVVDPLEISQITDYIVTYSCKGHETLKDEQEQMKTMILKYV